MEVLVFESPTGGHDTKFFEESIKTTHEFKLSVTELIMLVSWMIVPVSVPFLHSHLNTRHEQCIGTPWINWRGPEIKE